MGIRMLLYQVHTLGQRIFKYRQGNIPPDKLRQLDSKQADFSSLASYAFGKPTASSSPNNTRQNPTYPPLA